MPSCKLESRSDSGLFHSASLRFQRGDEEKMNWVSVCAVRFLHFFRIASNGKLATAKGKVTTDG